MVLEPLIADFPLCIDCMDKAKEEAHPRPVYSSVKEFATDLWLLGVFFFAIVAGVLLMAWGISRCPL